jgi:hypothetical protein
MILIIYFITSRIFHHKKSSHPTNLLQENKKENEKVALIISRDFQSGLLGGKTNLKINFVPTKKKININFQET